MSRNFASFSTSCIHSSRTSAFIPESFFLSARSFPFAIASRWSSSSSKSSPRVLCNWASSSISASSQSFSGSPPLKPRRSARKCAASAIISLRCSSFISCGAVLIALFLYVSGETHNIVKVIGVRERFSATRGACHIGRTRYDPPEAGTSTGWRSGAGLVESAPMHLAAVD